ncbi:MAG: SHOCT domain-containing protein [Candidatus Dormiibacterota bacterium]
MTYRYDLGVFPGFWALLMLLVLILVVGAVVWLAFELSGRRHPDRAAGARSASAELILAERLARGEIDEEEYRRRLGALRE